MKNGMVQHNCENIDRLTFGLLHLQEKKKSASETKKCVDLGGVGGYNAGARALFWYCKWGVPPTTE